MTGSPDSIPRETLPGKKQFGPLFFSCLFIGVIVAVVAAGLSLGSPSRWIGHALAGTLGLVLLALVVLTGAAQAGRVQFRHLRHPALLHRFASTAFSGLMVGTFFLGLRVTMGHGEEVLESIHGLVGLAVATLSTIQLVTSLASPRRQRIRTFHRILGYLIVPLFLFQLLLGLNAAHLFGHRGD